MIQSITGVVLAGGKSTRMGKEKALLPYGGRPLIHTVLDTLRSVFSRVIVSVRPEDQLGALPADRVPDHYPESGPIGGITSVLESGQKAIFCVACDMPFINPQLVEYISSFSGFDAVIPIWDDRLQVLHALYSHTILPLFQTAVREEHLRISDVFPKANIRYISASEIQEIDPKGASFENLNTPDEYERLLGDMRK